MGTGYLGNVVDDVYIVVNRLVPFLTNRLWRSLDEYSWNHVLVLFVVSLENLCIRGKNARNDCWLVLSRLLNCKIISPLALSSLRWRSVSVVACLRFYLLHHMNRRCPNLGSTLVIT